MTATQVVQAILGQDNVLVNVIPTEDLPGVYVLSRTWRYDRSACFQGFDDPRNGSIGLRNLDGTTPEDLAEAAHEAMHALKHKQGIDEKDHDEQEINKLAEQWLQSHLHGPELIAAIIHLDHSRNSYQ